MNRLFLYLVIFIFSACGQNGQNAKKDANDIAVGKIHLTLPASYKYVEKKGVDSYVALIISDRNDTFRLEYGYSAMIYRLFESPPPVLPLSQKDTITRNLGRETTQDDAFFSNTPKEDAEQGIFLTNYYMYDTINNVVVKIVQPKKIGHGITGIYVPETPDIGGLSIYAKNLDSTGNIEALRIFRTIKK